MRLIPSFLNPKAGPDALAIHLMRDRYFRLLTVEKERSFLSQLRWMFPNFRASSICNPETRRSRRRTEGFNLKKCDRNSNSSFSLLRLSPESPLLCRLHIETDGLRNFKKPREMCHFSIIPFAIPLLSSQMVAVNAGKNGQNQSFLAFRKPTHR